MSERAAVLSLILGFVGTLLLFFGGYGQPPFAGGPALAGPTFEKWRAEELARDSRRKLLQWVGLALLCFSFVVQIIAAWWPEFFVTAAETPPPSPTPAVVTGSPPPAPLILSILALVVSLVVGIGALVMARANLHRQIQVAAREAWRREFREQVAAYFANFAMLRTHEKIHGYTAGGEQEKRGTELADALTLHHHTIRLLIAEKGTQYAEFVQNMQDLTDAPALGVAAQSHEIYEAAIDILRREQAVIEADPWWLALLRLGAVGRRPWGWLTRDQPRFPDDHT